MSAVQALEELREGFVATVSHELRTPLALIRGYAETLLHLPLEPSQQRAYVERIDEATSRLAALVDQVLDVTHLQADPLILERRTTTFDSLVARLRGDLAMSRQEARLIVDAPAHLPAVEVDIARVGQILANLVGNALKYAPDDSPVVLGAAAAGRWLAVTVDVEGIGIPESDRVLVTEPFHRAWNVRESRIPGTGLGLFICRRLVEAHGGELTVGDRPDGRPGTRVRITLPLAPSEHGDD
jgi:signal transduction histidine kinase